MRYFIIPLVVAMGLVTGLPVSAQDAPASAPTTAPAPPRKVNVPPGLKALSVNGRNVFCEAADEAWVTAALNKLEARPKPATLPATLLQKLTDQRTSLLQQLAKDLALKDLTAAAAQYDTQLVKAIRTLDNYKPQIYYLVATPDRMASLMRDGWTDPHFYYNRAADAVTFSTGGLLNTDRPQDDVLFPAAYDKGATPEKKTEGLELAINETEKSIGSSIEIKARTTIGAALAQLVQDYGVKPLDLKDDQVWFGYGIAQVLSAKYLAQITNDSFPALMDMLTEELAANPLRMSAIDLLHPIDQNSLRNDALPAYYDTVRRKSARAVRFLIEKGGEGVLPKAISAVRDKKPANGDAMVKLIQESTGVDLMPLVI